MSIAIGNMQRYSPIPRTFAVQNKSSVFSEIIAPSGSTVSVMRTFDAASLLKNKEGSIALGCNAVMDYAMWYAEGSTEENPVIFARTIDANGREMEQTFSLNDIDPHNATYLEMLALQVHYKPDEEI